MSKAKNKEEILIYIITFVIVILLLQTGYFLFVGDMYPKVEEAGTFGDSFGGVNAFFAALAFGGVIIAIYLQSGELALQRRELIETRKVLKSQMEQLEAQNRTLLRQRFESNRTQQILNENE